jgi:RNA polymerase sigma factor (sigma-70 family)
VTVDPRFEAMYRAEFDRVFRATYLLTGNRAAAEEATQEAFARCLERWHRLGDQPWVVGWVVATAMNVGRRSLRKANRERVEVADVATVPDPGSDDRVESAADLWNGIRTLPARQQEAMVLHYAVDLPVSDVAAAMGCDPGTVKSHLSRARESLRRRLTNVEDRQEASHER